MKSIPTKTISRDRGAAAWTTAVLALCLTGVTAFGQASDSSRASSQPASSASTSDRSMTSGSSTTEEKQLKRSDRRFISKAAEDNHKEVAISQLASQRASDPEVRSYAQQIAMEHQQMTQELVQLAQSKGVTLENAAAMTAGSMSSTTHQSMDATRSASGSGVTGARESTNAGVASSHGAPRATGSSSTASTPASSGMPTNESTATSSTAATSSVASTAGVPADVSSDRHYRSLSKKSGAEFDKSYVDLMVNQHEADVKLFERAAKDAQDPEVRAFASRHLPALQGHLERANTLMKTSAAAE